MYRTIVINIMANWCFTKYVITGSKEDINKLNSILQKVSNDAMKSNESNLFLFVKELGFVGDKIYCRGSFDNVKLLNKSTMKLTTNTAWTPCYEVFEYMKKKFTSLNYYYKAEEDGNEVFETNDIEKKYFGYGRKYEAVDNRIMLLKLFAERFVLSIPLEEGEVGVEEKIFNYIEQYNQSNKTAREVIDSL